MIDQLLQISLEDIEHGFSYEETGKAYTCLICGEKFAVGEVFPQGGRFYDASSATRLHVEASHGSMLGLLASYDKKYTGITDNQKGLLQMMYDGLGDSEIARRTGVAPATVRHQRFVFREKAKQAKLYLAIFELVEHAMLEKRGGNAADAITEVHSGAKMVDDRYAITKAEEDKILRSVFESLQPLKLKVFSSREKKKIVTLRKIARQFERGKTYTEKEVNAALSAIYEDYATIRRYLIEYGFLQRTTDCKEYWVL